MECLKAPPRPTRFAHGGTLFARRIFFFRPRWEPVRRLFSKQPHNIAKNAYCSRDIYLQLERSVIKLVIIHSTQKKLIHWLL